MNLKNSLKQSLVFCKLMNQQFLTQMDSQKMTSKVLNQLEPIPLTPELKKEVHHPISLVKPH